MTDPTTVHTDLIERCRKGDREAFREVYDCYIKSMYNISMRILNNRNEAEDVLQESFMSAFGNLGQFKGTASFGSWLKRIVINRSIDAVKQRKNEVVPLGDEEIAEQAFEEEQEFPEYDPELINAAVQELPDGFRLIVTLFLFEDYSHKMIARKLNISESTSKSQYSRGRRKLAELIQQMHSTHARQT